MLSSKITNILWLFIAFNQDNKWSFESQFLFEDENLRQQEKIRLRIVDIRGMRDFKYLLKIIY